MKRILPSYPAGFFGGLLTSVFLMVSVIPASVLSVPGFASAAAKETITIGGTGCALSGIKDVAAAYRKKHPETMITIVPSLGSSGGIKALLAGSLDLALSARQLNSDEQAQGAEMVQYARTPFVFATNEAALAARGFTLEQVASLYSGETTTWPDNDSVRLIIRPEADTDTHLLKEMSPAMAKAVQKALSREGILTAVTDQENAGMLEKLHGAIGTMALSQIVSEKWALYALPLNKVTPSAKSLANGTYPYFKSFFAVTKSGSRPAVQRFLAFLLSPEGRAILARTEHLAPNNIRSR